MAHTASALVNTVHGNQRVVAYKVTNGANSSTAEVETGLSYVDFAFAQPYFGMASPSIGINQLIAATASVGTVSVKSGTSAASYLVVAFGQ